MTGCADALTLAIKERAKQGCTDILTLANEGRIKQGCTDALTLANEERIKQGCTGTLTLANEERVKQGCADMTLADDETVNQACTDILTLADDERVNQGCTEILTLANKERVKHRCTDKLALTDEERAVQGCTDVLTLENKQRVKQGCIDTLNLTDKEIAKHGYTDTLILADEERAKQGIHELEISFNGESGLKKNFNSCTKNPGHLNFEPTHVLHLDHLPQKFQWLKYFHLIKHLADLTVKLSVNFISADRPQMFPFSNYAGQRKLMAGSGCVTDVVDDRDIRCLQCPFQDCTETLGEHQVYGYITVVTAAHVVCDDVEARNTIVEFFDDYPDCKTNVRRARGVKVGAVSVDGDFCELLCVLHNKLVLEAIRSNLSRSKGLAIVRSIEDLHCEKLIPHDTWSVALFVDGSKKGFLYGSPFNQAISLSDDRETWPCPFTDCPEVSGVHEVYGYICILFRGLLLGGKEPEASKLTVEITYDSADHSRDKWKMKGVKFVSSVVHSDSRELVCVVHDREVFKKIKYVLLANKNIYLYKNIKFYCGIALAAFKDKLQIDMSSSFVDNDLKLCGDINYKNKNCVDTLMALLTCTIPRIEWAFRQYEHSRTALVDDIRKEGTSRPFRASVLRYLELLVDKIRKKKTARSFEASVLRYLEQYELHELEKYKNTIRWQLKNLLSQVPVKMDSLNRLLAEAEMEAARCLHGVANKLIVTRINGKYLSIVVYFSAVIYLDDRFEYMKVPSDIINDNLDDVDSLSPSDIINDNLDDVDSLSPSDIINDNLDDVDNLSPSDIINDNLDDVDSLSPSDIINDNLDDVDRLSPSDIINDNLDDIDNLSLSHSLSALNICGHAMSFPPSLGQSPQSYVGPPDSSTVFFPGPVPGTKLLVESRSGWSSLVEGVLETDVDNDNEDDDILLVHISHPHGQSKHITFGKQTQCHTGDGFYRPLYTAPTCPGSSGGPVWMIPASIDLGQVYGVPHSGCHDNQLSQGCSWTLYPS